MTEVAAALGLSADSSSLAAAVKELRNLDEACRAAVEGSGNLGRASSRAGAAAATMAKEQRAAERELDKVAKAYERARAAVDPLFNASKKYEGSLKALTAAERQGIITTTERLRISDMASAKYLALKAALDQTADAEQKAAAEKQKAATAYERLRSSVDSMFTVSKKYEAGVETLNTALRQGVISQQEYARTSDMLAQKILALKNQTDEAAQANQRAKAQQDQLHRSYEQTRASFDPLFAASKRYENATRSLDAALAAKIITEQQHARLNQMAAASMLTMSQAGQGTQRAMNGVNYAVTNASFQVQDFIVQVASGTDAMRALAQQAPQLLGALGFAGKLAMFGSIAGTVVAGAAAVYMAWRRTEDQTKNNTTAQDRYNESLQDYIRYAGSAAEKSNMMGRGLGNQSLNRSFEEFTGHLENFINKSEGAYTNWERFQDILSGRAGIGKGNRVADMLESISEAMNLPEQQASGLFTQIEKLTQTAPTSLVAVVEQVEALDASLRNAYGSMSRAPEGVQEFWTVALEMGVAASDEIRSSMEAVGSNLDDVNAKIKEDINLQQERRAISEEYVANSEQQARMIRAIYEYGEESAMVEALRDEAARDTLDTYLEQEGITGLLADNMRAALNEEIDATNQTEDWAAAMARVNAQLQGAISLLNSIGGGMIQAAGIRAANEVLDAGGKAVDAEKARRRREEELRLYNEQDRMIAEGTSTPGISDMMLENQRKQWEAEDAYQARIDAAREAEREAAKSARKSGKGSRGGKSDAEKEAERERRENERAAERIFESTRTNMERLKMEQEELNQLYQEGYFGKTGSVTAMDTLNRAMQQVAEQYDPLLQKTEEWTQSMVQGFASMWTGAQSFGDAISGIMMKLADMAAMTAFETIFNSPGMQKGIGAVIGGIFGMTPNAKGGVYQSPSLSAYSNQVVSQPTVFAFAKGAGLMGEAGPEAIMPLSRGPDGRLGVTASGGQIGTSSGGDLGQPIQVELLVKAAPGDMFVPIVEDISKGQASGIVQVAIERANKELPDKIADHLDDQRYR